MEKVKTLNSFCHGDESLQVEEYYYHVFPKWKTLIGGNWDSLRVPLTSLVIAVDSSVPLVNLWGKSADLTTE